MPEAISATMMLSPGCFVPEERGDLFNYTFALNLLPFEVTVVQCPAKEAHIDGGKLQEVGRWYQVCSQSDVLNVEESDRDVRLSWEHWQERT
ncbi:hypothetical protein FOPE_01463 [Fonsecaea pedrosoi]|nr:hypothetical protein FOPE_01463 [Fonsecaea pedrosoi]